MANTLKSEQSNVICGLGTFTHTVATTGPYIASCMTTNHLPSSVSISITQSGSRSATITSTAPAASQRVENVQKVFNCTAADVITIVISSAAVTDNQLNNVKSIVKITQGMS